MDQDGKIIYQGLPQESILVSGTEGLEMPQKEETVSLSKEERTSAASETSYRGTKITEQAEIDRTILQETDATRQTGDTAVHKYYARAAGLKSALVFIAALIVGAFTDAFSRKSSQNICAASPRHRYAGMHHH